MKQVLLFALLVILSFTSKAQECSYPPFAAAKIYYTTTGAGLELGFWPTKQSRLGAFIGGSFVQSKIMVYDFTKERSVEKTILNNIVYVKAQLRVLRYMHLSAAVGFQNKDIGASVYREIGMKLVLPINDERGVAFYAEPISTNNGFRTNIGFSFALN